MKLKNRLPWEPINESDFTVQEMAEIIEKNNHTKEDWRTFMDGYLQASNYCVSNPSHELREEWYKLAEILTKIEKTLKEGGNKVRLAELETEAIKLGYEGAVDFMKKHGHRYEDKDVEENIFD